MDGSEVVISLHIPGAKEVMTRLEPADENRVKEVDILVFDHTEEGISTCLYSTTAYGLNEGDNSFTVRLRHTDEGESVDLWVIANGRSVVNDKKTELAGKTKEEIRLLLLATESSTATLIPMWGTKEDVTISKNGAISNLAPVNMIRMVAKINVRISQELINQTNFQLTSVEFYNRNTVGCIAPAAANGDWTDPSSPHAAYPSLPTDPKPAVTANSIPVLSYPANNIIADFYTFETAAGLGYGASAYYESEPCLIITGKYKASDDSRNLADIPETYYRVEFYAQGEEGTAGKYLALLRNHRYTVTFKKINGPGYSQKEGALKGRPVNVDVALDWADNDEYDVVYDERNFLAVSSSTIEIPDQMSIEVLTDCESGWVIGEKSGDFNLSQSAGGERTKVQLSATALYTNETRDVGYFYIVAGRFKTKINVHQTYQDISFKEATPVTNGEVAYKGNGASVSFEGDYDGGIEVIAYVEPMSIIGSGKSPNSLTADVVINQKNRSVYHKDVHYMLSIRGVDNIPIAGLVHKQRPDWGSLKVSARFGLNYFKNQTVSIKNYYVARNGWSPLALNQGLVTMLYTSWDTVRWNDLDGNSMAGTWSSIYGWAGNVKPVWCDLNTQFRQNSNSEYWRVHGLYVGVNGTWYNSAWYNTGNNQNTRANFDLNFYVLVERD
jgi:hypothetical protein